jgi:hypothetical protein
MRFAGQMVFVRRQHDSGRARSALEFGHLQEVSAPKGQDDSAQGFNPGEPPPRATRPEGAADRTY